MVGYSHMQIEPDAEPRELFRRIVDLGTIKHWGTALATITPGLRC
jgi:hypothetical protein